MNTKILYFDLDIKDEPIRLAKLLAALNQSGPTYEVKKTSRESIVEVHIGEGY